MCRLLRKALSWLWEDLMPDCWRRRIGLAAACGRSVPTSLAESGARRSTCTVCDPTAAGLSEIAAAARD